MKPEGFSRLAAKLLAAFFVYVIFFFLAAWIIRFLAGGIVRYYGPEYNQLVKSISYVLAFFYLSITALITNNGEKG